MRHLGMGCSEESVFLASRWILYTLKFESHWCKPMVLEVGLTSGSTRVPSEKGWFSWSGVWGEHPKLLNISRWFQLQKDWSLSLPVATLLHLRATRVFTNITAEKLSLASLGMVVHTCDPSTQKAEAGGLRVWGQPGLHSKSLSQKIYIYVAFPDDSTIPFLGV
jgi:hypothetical protein